MKKKNGFTLIELLAVILIISLLMFLAVTIVRTYIRKAKNNSTKSNALIYIKVVNNAADSATDKYDELSGFYDVTTLDSLGIKVKNTAPESGFVFITDYGVKSACLVYKELKVVINDGRVSSVEEGTCTFTNNYNQDVELYDIPFTGALKNVTINKTGKYLIEVWGAQGKDASNSKGGYGGYSKGIVTLNKNDVIYVAVGGTNGYNGGASAPSNYTSSSRNDYYGTGGGATHIATRTGLLKTLSSNVGDILIVAGGGGGGFFSINTSPQAWIDAGHGGGFLGNSSHIHEGNGISYSTTCTGSGGTQVVGGLSSCASTTAGSFGTGGSSNSSSTKSGGGGGGFYGGGYAGGGGSGYIGNESLTNKAMYCYNCQVSEEVSTKTVSTTNASEVPTSNHAKIGNGHARITFIE